MKITKIQGTLLQSDMYIKKSILAEYGLIFSLDLNFFFS